MAAHGGDVDDADFLALVEEAEVQATSSYSKRRRLSSSSPATAAVVEEGCYMAALKGSHSSLWKQQKFQSLPHKKTEGLKTLAATGGGGGGGGGGGCFKCGGAGHWARDCPSSTAAGGTGRQLRFGGPGDGEDKGGLEEKACPCGAGRCVVFTSTTAKNPGRKFYRCPIRDNGGCNFFEWCDNPSPGVPNARIDSSYQSNASVADMLCPCGAGICLVLTAKTGKNVGRQFYCCPENQGGGSCGFFKWCSEQETWTTTQQASQTYRTNVTSSTQISSDRNYSSCFKCGQGGHWAKDCLNQSPDPYADKGGKTVTSSGSDTCFKCGKAGHWSRDCPTLNCGTGASSGRKSYASGLQKSRGY